MKEASVTNESTGLKELENEDGAITYNEMTKLLKPLIEEEKGKLDVCVF